MNIKLIISTILAIITAQVLKNNNIFIQTSVEFIILIHQLPVIPYVFISIFTGIGSLNKNKATRALYNLFLILLSIWTISLIILFIFGNIFDNAIDINNIVNVKTKITIHNLALMPSLIFLITSASISLIYLPNKDKLIEPLIVINQMLEKIFDILLYILPLSIYILLTHAIMSLREINLSQMSIYLFISAAFCSYFVFWIYPWALRVFTDLPYNNIKKDIFPCVYLSLLAGDCAVALPLIIKTIKKLSKTHNSQKATLNLVPIAFALPMTGSIGNLLFIFFAKSIYNFQFDISSYLIIFLCGPITMFSEPIVSIPTLLSWLSFEPNSTPLYMLLSVLTDPIFDATEAFSIILICHILDSVMNNSIKLNYKKIIIFLAPSVLVAAILINCTIFIIRFMR